MTISLIPVPSAPLIQAASEGVSPDSDSVTVLCQIYKPSAFGNVYVVNPSVGATVAELE